jgi:hypothetical protein
MITVPAGVRDMDLSSGGERFACTSGNGTIFLYTFRPAPPGSPKPPAAKKK